MKFDLEGDSRDQLRELMSRLLISNPDEQLQMQPCFTDSPAYFNFISDDNKINLIGIEGFGVSVNGSRIVSDAVRWMGSSNPSAERFDGWVLARRINGEYQVVGIALSGGPMFK